MELLAGLFPPKTYAAEVSAAGGGGKAYSRTFQTDSGRSHRSDVENGE